MTPGVEGPTAPTSRDGPRVGRPEEGAGKSRPSLPSGLLVPSFWLNSSSQKAGSHSSGNACLGWKHRHAVNYGVLLGATLIKAVPCGGQDLMLSLS